MKNNNLKKVLILGGDGMFAYDMFNVLKKDKEFEPIPLSKEDLDITEKNEVLKYIITQKPFAVVNTVGPAVDICDENPEFARKINIEAVKYCAIACNDIGAIFVHLSTCGLFGDKKRFYTEMDNVVLKTMYAKTKYEGEKIALSNCDKTIIVRPGWMYGGSIRHKKNFVVNRLREFKGLDQVSSAMDKFGNPTYSKDAAKAIRYLIKSGKVNKIFHLTNSGGGSRADYIESIIKFSGLKTKVERVDSSFFPRKSDVPDCELLDNSYLDSMIDLPMRDWKVALKEYINSLDLNLI